MDMAGSLGPVAGHPCESMFASSGSTFHMAAWHHRTHPLTFAMERFSMSYVVPVPRVPAVPVVGAEPGAVFPVHRIYCVGRNYVDHAIEMGHSGREPPFFF